MTGDIHNMTGAAAAAMAALQMQSRYGVMLAERDTKIETLQVELSTVTRQRDELLDTIEEMAEFLKDYEDASMEPGDDRFKPNKAMRLRCQLLDVLAAQRALAHAERGGKHG